MEQITGHFQNRIYCNFKNGFTIFKLKPSTSDISDGELITCKGNIPMFTEKMPISLEGEWKEDEKGNSFFAVQKGELRLQTKAQKTQFLQSLPRCGIGEKTLERIFELCGEDFLNNIETKEVQEKLATIKNMTETKQKGFTLLVGKFLKVHQLYQVLAPIGGTYSQAEKLNKEYGDQIYSLMEKNPYLLYKERGVTFGMMDALALQQGLPFYHQDRIDAIIKMAIRETRQWEDCYYTYQQLKERIRKLEMKMSAYKEFIPEGLLAFSFSKSEKIKAFLQDGELCIMERQVYHAEQKFKKEFLRLLDTKEPRFTKDEMEELKKKEWDIALDESQKEALGMLEDTAPAVLTGGPGTGKTTIIKRIVAEIQGMGCGYQIAICAPTGRAAQRIQESSGLQATTIHKLLEYTNINGDLSLKKGKNDPLEQDYIIVDEFSMVGIFLCSQLLEAMKDGAKLIMVGDTNQLGSLEPGALLRDISSSGLCFVHKLTSVHRQAGESAIVKNSRKVEKGDTSLTFDDCFLKQSFERDEDAATRCLELIKETYSPINPTLVQVIAPVKVGALGIEKINQSAQEMFHDEEESCFFFESKRFYMGDKVMTVRNNYEEGNSYYNGDIGVVDHWSGEGVRVELGDGRKITIPMDRLDDLELAYAMTVHKCQGSEADTVIFLLSQNLPPNMIKRSIFYTAITRAKRKVILLETGDMIKPFIRTADKERKTTLKEQLNKSKTIKWIV